MYDVCVCVLDYFHIHSTVVRLLVHVTLLLFSHPEHASFSSIYRSPCWLYQPDYTQLAFPAPWLESVL